MRPVVINYSYQHNDYHGFLIYDSFQYINEDLDKDMNVSETYTESEACMQFLIIAINIEINTNIHNSGLIETIEDNYNDLDK